VRGEDRKVERKATVSLVLGVLFLVSVSLMSVSLGRAAFPAAYLFSAPQSTEDWWPSFHHDPAHTGYSTSTVPNTNHTLWTYSTGAFGMDSSPAVADGMAFVGSEDGTVYALNASSGALVWSNTTGGILSSPAVADGTVYAGSFDGNVYALDEATGNKVWNYTTGNDVYWSSPAVADGVVFVGSGDNNVYALNASSGALIWNFTTGNHVWSSPAVADGVIYAGSEDGTVYALNVSTGALVWNYTTNGAVDSSPAVADGVVFVGSQDGKVYALNATTGTQIWNYRTGGAVHYSSPAVADGLVFIGSLDNNVYALNASNGALIWSYTAHYWVASSPAVAGGIVFVGSTDYRVYALNASTGTLVWNYKTSGAVNSSPAVADGVVYVGSQDGTVYAFGKIQYRLTVDTNPPGVAPSSGAGWYDAGTYAAINTSDYVYLDPAFSRYRFTGWTTTDMSEFADPTAPSTNVLMDRSKTVTANYTLQYNVSFDASGVHGDFSGAVVTIDGNNYVISSFQNSFWWDNGSSHSFAYQSPLVVEPNAKQYVWNNTSGLSALQSETINVTASGSITATYETQYYLTLETDPPGITSPSQAGWYDDGTYALLSTVQYVNVVSGSSRYGFHAWKTENMSELADPSATSTVVLMDGNKTVTANYVLQCRIFLDQTGIGNDFAGTVVSIDGVDYGVRGLPAFFWWDNGSSHSFSFHSPLLVAPYARQYVWNTTSGLPSSQSGTITVNGPDSVTGNYLTQYNVTFAQSGLDSSASGTVITINGTVVPYSSTPYSLWVNSGNALYFSYINNVYSRTSGKQFSLVSANASSPLTVTAPIGVTGIYHTQYQSMFEVTTPSPVNILVISPNGSHVGYNWSTQSIENEISGASYTGPETDPQAITIPSPTPGAYTIDAYGTGTGPYTITINSIAQNGSTLTTITWNGTASPGQLYQNVAQLQANGTIIIPEFSSLIILALFMTTVLLIVIAERKLKLKRYACDSQVH
jgi:outer membrane protein assembly factor BamB